MAQQLIPNDPKEGTDPNYPSLFPADVPDRYAPNRVYPNVPAHTHNGVDSPRIPASSVIPVLRGSGNINFATSLTRYKLSITGNPTQMLFYGNATHTSGGAIDIRAMLMGSAQFGPSYFLQPVNASSVAPGIIGNVIQSGQAFVVSNSATDVRTLSTEGHLVTVNSAGSIVARATIPNPWTYADASFGYTTKGWGVGFVYIDVYLASGWEINGNCVIT